MKNNLYKNITQEILAELWENAVFNDSAKQLLEKIIAKQSQQKDPTDNSSLEIPLQEAHDILSTIRNRDLINSNDQDLLKKTVVGFFGLSVGSNAALAWMMESRAEAVKIIDPDIISPSNLNRLLYGWDNVGRLKIESLKEKLNVICPYANIITSTSTDNKKVMKLINTNPKIDVIIDEIDDLSGKVNLRKIARARKIPVIMCTDIGDNICIDIERYDLTPQMNFFLGRIPGIEHIDFSTLSYLERIKLIIEIVGFGKNSEAMLDSLLSIGKTLSTWPQLGATAFITGGTIATTIKKIVLGENVKSGRYYISLDDLLVSDYNSNERITRRNKKILAVKKRFHMV